MVVQRRRIAVEEGRSALAAWLRAWIGESGPGGGSDGGTGFPGGAGVVPRSTVATAVRYSLEEVAARAPGNSVEVRVPPYGVTQCVQGPRHTRGTPPSVIECDAATWLAMVSGQLSWTDALGSGRAAASGLRADLSDLLPL